MIRKSLLALAALTLTGAALAAPYTITGSFDADPAVNVLTGSFDFSDAQVAAGGFDGAFDLTTLSFTFLGQSYTLAQATDAYVQFEGGSLTFKVLMRGVTSTPRSAGFSISSGFFFAFMMFGSVT